MGPKFIFLLELSTLVSSANIFCILARDSELSVIFRRGPSKVVQLLSWDRGDDQIEPGQWLKGRIYERRADLSPSGKLLVYFAANQKPPHYSWTALSKPPYLTALCLWENGSTWGGGGLFETESKLLINGSQSSSDKGETPKRFKVGSLETQTNYLNVSGLGIYRNRLKRDGWEFNEEKQNNFSCIKYSGQFSLELNETTGNISPQGRWNESIYRLTRQSQEIFFDQLDWAEFDSNGDFLFAKESSIFRLEQKKLDTVYGVDEATLICDLSKNRFEAIESPTWANRWV